MHTFDKQDCEQTGYGISLTGRVVVLRRSAILAGQQGQLFFCTGENRVNPNPMGRTAFLVSLTTGEECRAFRCDVVGTLKPELLPEEAKLQLSQIRPSGALDLETNEAQYSAYSFLQDGRYAAGVWLCSAKEAADYVAMQKDYQHRVLICDRDDFAVLEVVDGKQIFPDEQTMEDNGSSQEPGAGMRMS
ncbi:MAG: hypothetical protein LUE24_10165 [Lachnospiraceae bacterium]|nr:hypothetical protein [Lachnospiraceae bacterium]